MKNKLLNFALIKFFLILGSSQAIANLSNGEWQPQIVEKMYILPPKQLDRVLNNDFRNSSLYLNLKTADDKIKSRYSKIDQLNKSIPQFKGDEQIELKHQVIVEKKEYITDMSERLKIKREHLLTKKRFFEKIKRKTLFQKGNQNFKAQSKFQASREKALQRSKKLDKKISNLLIGNNMSNNSKYFSEYQKTMLAMQKLETKIKSHPKFQENDLLLNSENKLESLNVFIDKLESELSVLALKEQVLTKMAKLVSLDAMELADSLQINISQGNEFKDVNDPTDSINLFLN
jgi:hypothetical protein|tara:strand:- start:4 stop:870 length:867 start_codon:yes stop_codon:yes gene_type:complete